MKTVPFFSSLEPANEPDLPRQLALLRCPTARRQYAEMDVCQQKEDSAPALIE